MGKYIGQDITYGFFEKQTIPVLDPAIKEYELNRLVSSTTAIQVVCERAILEPNKDYTIDRNSNNKSVLVLHDIDLSTPPDGELSLYVIFLGAKLLVPGDNDQNAELWTAIDAKADISTVHSYVDGSIQNLINFAPTALDTLSELSAALGNDANFSATVTGQITAVQSGITNVDGRISSIENVTIPQLNARLENEDFTFLKLDGSRPMVGTEPLVLPQNYIQLGNNTPEPFSTQTKIHSGNIFSIKLDGAGNTWASYSITPVGFAFNMLDEFGEIIRQCSLNQQAGGFQWIDRDSVTGVVTPVTPTEDAQLTTKKYVDDGLSSKLDVSSLAPVAFTGSYIDLTGAPQLTPFGGSWPFGGSGTLSEVPLYISNEANNLSSTRSTTTLSVDSISQHTRILDSEPHSVYSTERNLHIKTGNDTPQTIFSLNVPADCVITFDVTFCAKNAQVDFTTPRMLTGKLKFGVTRQLFGDATLASDFVGPSKELDTTDSAPYDFGVSVSGNIVEITVTGGAGEFVAWGANIRYVQLTRENS